MQYTLIIAFQGTEADDPLLHALACVLGPARVGGMEALAEEPDAATGVYFYLRGAADGWAFVAAVRAHRAWLVTRRVHLIVYDPAGPMAWETAIVMEAAVLLNGLQIKPLPDDPERARGAILDMGVLQTFQDKSRGHLPPDELKPYVEDFLISHNTCALATWHFGVASCRAMEYHYAAGHIYMASEGGEKFAGLLGNRQAAISIFEPYQGFEKLAGMQLQGYASVPMFASPEYERCLLACGLQPARLARLPVTLHPIDVSLYSAEYLWSGFSHLGVDVRQQYHWDPWRARKAPSNGNQPSDAH